MKFDPDQVSKNELPTTIYTLLSSVMGLDEMIKMASTNLIMITL